MRHWLYAAKGGWCVEYETLFSDRPIRLYFGTRTAAIAWIKRHL